MWKVALAALVKDAPALPAFLSSSRSRVISISPSLIVPVNFRTDSLISIAVLLARHYLET